MREIEGRAEDALPFFVKFSTQRVALLEVKLGSGAEHAEGMCISNVETLDSMNLLIVYDGRAAAPEHGESDVSKYVAMPVNGLSVAQVTADFTTTH
ncbi:hypothetical protein D3C81_1951430 [compost metagenome]